MTQLPPSPFISNPSVTHEPPTEGPAVALSRTSVLDAQTDAAAEPISQSALASAMTADTAAAPDLTDPPVAAAVLIAEPTSSTGGPQETPASAPSKNPDVGVLADRIDWHAFFEAVMDERIVLFELYEEVPLFIRDGSHLRRWTA